MGATLEVTCTTRKQTASVGLINLCQLEENQERKVTFIG
jgi:hypothetical protein